MWGLLRRLQRVRRPAEPAERTVWERVSFGDFNSLPFRRKWGKGGRIGLEGGGRLGSSPFPPGYRGGDKGRIASGGAPLSNCPLARGGGDLGGAGLAIPRTKGELDDLGVSLGHKGVSSVRSVGKGREMPPPTFPAKSGGGHIVSQDLFAKRLLVVKDPLVVVFSLCCFLFEALLLGRWSPSLVRESYFGLTDFCSGIFMFCPLVKTNTESTFLFLLFRFSTLEKQYENSEKSP